VLRLYLYARVRLYHHLLHTGPRVQQAPGIPCALLFGAKRLAKPGRNAPREGGGVFFVGWVERSETHHHGVALMGITALHPSYGSAQ
jgi:hypothetical protein